MRKLANGSLDALKDGTYSGVPLLEHPEFDVLTGITFEESKEFEEKDFDKTQCRLNNPNSCWQPLAKDKHKDEDDKEFKE